MRLFTLIGILSITLLEFGCASDSPTINSNGNYQIKFNVPTQGSWGGAKKNTYTDAEKVCAEKGLGIDVIRTNETNDGAFGGGVFILEFSCYDRAARAKANQLEAERQRVIQTERQRVIQAEKDRLAEEERKRNEEERKRYEAEQKAKEAERLRMEALKAAEWERTRPHREAEQRRALAAEEARLNSICPTYFIARQTCAAAVWYSDCMKYRYGKNYSKSDDNTCFNR
jgi:hypothetical protein